MAYHPDLVALEERYNELVSAAENGHISVEDALSTLAAMSVTDGGGAIWGIDGDGDFVRSDFPGAPAVKANPSNFISSQDAAYNPETGLYGHVGEPAGPDTSDWPEASSFAGGAPQFTQTPQTSPFPTPSSPTPSSPFPRPTTPSTSLPSTARAMDPDLLTPPQHQVAPPTWATSLTGSSLADAEAKRTGPSGRAKIQASIPAGLSLYVRKNKALLLIAVIGISLLLFAWIRSSSGGSSPSTLPTTPENTPTATAPATLPVSSAPTSKQPTSQDISKVTSAFTSGDQQVIASQLATTPDPVALAKEAAFCAGLDKAGLSLSAGPLGSSNGQVIQQWTVTDLASKKTISTAKVTWVLADGKWKLKALPTFN